MGGDWPWGNQVRYCCPRMGGGEECWVRRFQPCPRATCGWPENIQEIGYPETCISVDFYKWENLGWWQSWGLTLGSDGPLASVLTSGRLPNHAEPQFPLFKEKALVTNAEWRLIRLQPVHCQVRLLGTALSMARPAAQGEDKKGLKLLKVGRVLFANQELFQEITSCSGLLPPPCSGISVFLEQDPKSC